MRRALFTLGLLGALIAPAHAGPSAPSDAERARAFVDAATALFQAGDYAGALATFRKAEPLGDALGDPAGIQWNIARCLEELGRAEEAIAAFEHYLQMPDTRSGHAEARARIAALERRHLGRVAVTCDAPGAKVRLVPDGGSATEEVACPATWKRLPPGRFRVLGKSRDEVLASRETTVTAGGVAKVSLSFPGVVELAGAPPGAAILVDAALAGRTPPHPVPLHAVTVAPGRHVLDIEAEKNGRIQRVIELAAGQRLRLDLGEAVAAVPQDPPAAAVEEPDPPPEPPALGTSASAVGASVDREGEADAGPGALPWIVAGGGAAALATGALFIMLADDRFGDAESAHEDYRAATSPEAITAARSDVKTALGDGRTYQLAGYSLLAAGVVAGGVAAWLFTDGDDAPVAVTAGPDRAVVGWSGRW